MDYKEKVIALLNSKELSKEQKEKLEDIFPELKESEDEKMRKSIIYALRNGGFYDNDKTDEAIAWLEKQGKKIDAIENFDTEFEKQVSHLIASTINKEHEYNEGFVKWAANALLNYAKHELEKQGEQKPVDVDYNPFDDFRKSDSEINPSEFDARLNTLLKEFESLPKEELVNSLAFYLNVVQNDGTYNEQKPIAWSEEDETKIKSIIALLKSPSLCAMDGNKGIVDESIKYLNSLKNKVQPQPKQEWSEEDETYLDHVFTAVKAYYSDDKGHENPWREELLRWLKLLKPQNIGYNPYKATVESIAKMCNKYKDYVCAKEVANDFLNNVSAKCREAIEYDKKYPQKQWKPSEEQMEALDDAIAICSERDYETECRLDNLRQELKKLREE